MTHLRAALAGDPVAHSLSPTLHQAAAAAIGWTADYALRHIPTGTLPDHWHDLLQLHGFNLTIPHKRTASTLVDQLTAAAAATGAVNTVARKDGQVVGHNTDVEGFAAAWGEPIPGRVLVLGAGGAARAVVFALRDHPCSIEVYARRPDAVAALAQGTGHPLAALPEAMTGAAGLINCLPPIPLLDALPYERLARARVHDLNYGARATVALAARRAGLTATDGLPMLAAQGCAAFAWWTGQRPPLAPVLEALRRAH